MRLSIVLPIIAAIGLAWLALDQNRLVYATPENESTFLKTYSPKTVIDRFKAANFSEEAALTSGGAGREFATHEADFEPTVVINAQDWPAMMLALRKDVASRLTSENGEVLQQTDTGAGGFDIRYTIGNTEGTVHAEPLESAAPGALAAADTSLGKVTVSLRIRVHEKWFRSERQGKAKKTA